METFTTVYLHGNLGRKFGKEWRLNVRSVAEAIKAIDINLKGALKQYWREKGRDKKYKIKVGEYFLNDEKEILSNSDKPKEIHIMPFIKGRSSGLGKIIAGIVLIIVGYFTFGSTSAWGMALISGGVGMALGGVVQLLTPIPNFNQNAGQSSATFGGGAFQGNAATAIQGAAVPVVYGEMMVAPTPIAISLSNQDMIILSNGSIGLVTPYYIGQTKTGVPSSSNYGTQYTSTTTIPATQNIDNPILGGTPPVYEYIPGGPSTTLW